MSRLVRDERGVGVTIWRSVQDLGHRVLGESAVMSRVVSSRAARKLAARLNRRSVEPSREERARRGRYHLALGAETRPQGLGWILRLLGASVPLSTEPVVRCRLSRSD